MKKGLPVTEQIQLGESKYHEGLEIHAGPQTDDYIRIPWHCVREVAYAMLVAKERYDKGESLPDTRG